MRNNKLSTPTKAVSVIAGLAFTAAVGLTACGNDDDALDGTANDSATSGEEAGHNAADVEFAQGMIPHHVQAVDMSELVPERSDMPELRTLADEIQAAQQPEIDQMTEMLESWGEDVPDPDDPHAGHGDTSGMEGMMSDEEMAALENASGAEFDRMWLTMMIEHHEGAISMSETVLADGSDAEVEELAAEIIEVQREEIDLMRDLLEEVPS
ncbi:DUF305 domain-containing protein [Phytoactinopolyspora mesophila]|uniref:DUF305 domain-containing protein n=1 Tax=Phytoactinopolyspora mesophila TaxID=2650750 RepID=A0A7K3M1Y7_9ACTN|nr:DUF305 domain-containing protein [Phytoactinopolyspora mesophila]NDL57311.1 DUF305 domain-containing protein [Phytoactinopolyspora mesophila]